MARQAEDFRYTGPIQDLTVPTVAVTLPKRCLRLRDTAEQTGKLAFSRSRQNKDMCDDNLVVVLHSYRYLVVQPPLILSNPGLTSHTTFINQSCLSEVVCHEIE